MKMVTGSEKKFDIFNNVIMFFVLLLCLYPFWYVFILSLSDVNQVDTSKIWIVPKAFTLMGYKIFFSNPKFIDALFVSVKRTVIGTLLSVLLNAMFAYALSKKNLIGRKLISMFLLITMYFGGGLIPFFLLLKSLRLLNNFWGLVLPSLYGAWNIFVMRAYFTSSIPESLIESAVLDGANDITIFFEIVLPLSLPILATIALFSAVGHWNDWFTGQLIMTLGQGIPLSTLLMRILFGTQRMVALQISASAKVNLPPSETIKMAAVIVAMIPILCVYPFLQKYFVIGIMIGALKE